MNILPQAHETDQPGGRRRWLTQVAAVALGTIALGAGAPAALAQAEGSKPVLLVVGDSLSAGYGLPQEAGWVTLLQKRVDQEGHAYRVVNASISGDTTSGGVSRLDALLTRWKPAVVIVELGGNDALRGLPLNMTEQNLDKMVAQSLAAKAKVMVVGMQIPPNYGRDYTTRFNQIFATVAKKHNVPLVPFLLEGIAENRDLFQSDGIHPVASAQPRLLDNVWPTLKPLLGKS